MPTSHGWGRLYYNVSVIDCETKEVLDELLRSSELEKFVVRHLSDRSVIVNTQDKAKISRVLARRGHPYRVIDLPPKTATPPPKDPRR